MAIEENVESGVIESATGWQKPREQKVPVFISLWENAEQPVQLVVTEMCVLQRDIAVEIMLGVAKHVTAVLEKLFPEGLDDDGEEGLDDDGEGEGLIARALSGLNSADADSLGPRVFGAVRDVLGGKLTDVMCTILANKPNAVAAGVLNAGAPLTREVAAKMTEILKSELRMRDEPAVLRAFLEVEDIGSLLGNWRTLWTETMTAVQGTNQTQ